MAVMELDKIVLDGGVRSVNFFNGRLLSGEDMSREQQTSRETRNLLGQAIGEGIVYGLEVSKTAGAETLPRVTVRPGLAVNRCGQMLRLANTVDLSLVRPADGSSSVGSSTFAPCAPLQKSTYVTGAGVYLLVVAPARASEGRAPVSGLGNNSTDCSTKYNVDAVQFRLIELDFTADELNNPVRLRSHLASRCFGLAELAVGFLDPFAISLTSYGLMDSLRPKRLTDCDVPLAVLFWTAAGGIQFIDLWSVRRKVTQQIDSVWPSLVSSRRLSEAQAQLFHFEDYVQDLCREINPHRIIAADRLVFLPPVGIVPLATTSRPDGFNAEVFFGTQASLSVPMLDGDSVRALVAESFHHQAIALDDQTKIQLYLIWENVQAIEQGIEVRLNIMFASCSLRYRGVARFGRARYSLDRFAPFLI